METAIRKATMNIKGRAGSRLADAPHKLSATEAIDIEHSMSGNRLARLRSMMSGQRIEFLLMLVVVAMLVAGWSRRGHVYLSPEDGAGYLLGILGGVMMLSLTLYPLRKYVRWARFLGKVSLWFRIHMFLGVLGPVAILFHSNFQLGSLNGTIALFAMLLVAGSGLFGRYFYSRIHYGLYGRKADLAHLSSDTTALRGCMQYIFDESPVIRERLEKLENLTMRLPHDFLPSLWHVVRVSVLSRWTAITTGSELRKAINSIRKRDRLTGKTLASLNRVSRFYLDSYFESIRKVAGFGFYERLFSLWHVLHMPLFIMLVLAGIVHVIAVHMY